MYKSSVFWTDSDSGCEPSTQIFHMVGLIWTFDLSIDSQGL